MATAIMKQKEVPEMDDVEEIISKISEDSPYKRRPTQKRTWMTVPEMGKLLGLKRQIDTGWCIKMFLNLKRLLERYESILPALKNGTPIRLNTIKLPEKNQGKN
ncbi:MAG: hypothetical protein ACLVE7_05660 [Coprococcus comes]